MELLPLLVDDFISGLHFPKTMKWGNFDIRFVRPIQWILINFDGKPVPYTFQHIESKGITYGHRLLGSHKPVIVSDFSDYCEKLRAEHVEIDPEIREQIISSEVNNLIKKDQEYLHTDEQLLNENIYLTEYPRVFRGAFREKYLEIPQPVLISAIRKHQKAFTLVDANGQILPAFLVISNMPLDSMDEIRSGYERVLEARLADAHFFFREDLKQPLADRHRQLSKVVYHKELGSLEDKTERIRKLAGILCNLLSIDPGYIPLIDRAAYLCKSDLVTEIVQEFPDLQGIMGCEYALKNGENPEVAKIIGDQYLPRFPGDKLPSGKGGAIVSLADRMDTIIGGFGLDMIPTGTKDPYGLRRTGRGLIEILCAFQFAVPMNDWVKES
ncbi:MAG: glycine--tRNA ligase subunit beta, partial [Candidatus Schekmanbacteria bacterium RBG_13_48_7]